MYSYSKQRVLKKALIFTATSAIFAFAQASTVAPPPLPTGSHMVLQNAGMNPDEIKRNKRAHHHNKHHKKDVTRDDTIDDVLDDNDKKSGIGKYITPPKSK
jgi:hypothetical protein